MRACMRHSCLSSPQRFLCWSHINRERIHLRNINILWEDIETDIKGRKQASSFLSGCLMPRQHNIYTQSWTHCVSVQDNWLPHQFLEILCSLLPVMALTWPSPTAVLPRAPQCTTAFPLLSPSSFGKNICLAEDRALSLHESRKTLKKGWQKTPTEPKTVTHDFV